MEKIYREEKNTIHQNIQYKRTAIERYKITISNLKHQQGSDFVRKSIEKNKDQIVKLGGEIGSLEKRLEDLRGGLLDKELQSQILLDSGQFIKSLREAKQKKVGAKQKKEQNREISRNKFLHNKQLDRSRRYLQKEMRKAYWHYSKAADTIPEYMKKNLREMPQNKAYKWKDVILFGNKKIQKNKPTAIFNRIRGGILEIEEWTPTRNSIYHKKGKDKKILVYQQPWKSKLQI